MLKLNTTQQFRRDNSAVWAEKKPILLEGEPGLELDTGKIKIGDGVSDWNALPYFSIDSESKADVDLSNISDIDFLNKGKSAGLLSTVSKSDVGLSNVVNERQYSAANPPPYPVASVNGKTGSITGLATVTNMVNGSSAGSVRTISSTPESASYKIGAAAFAEGSSCMAAGDYSHSEGYGSSAPGGFSHAEGRNAIASGNISHAEGFNTTASGAQSHAEGYNTKAIGDYSHAEGHSTEASGVYSHTEGTGTFASGNYSHAEGRGTKASGVNCHAEGYNTEARGSCTHAEGIQTIATGSYSHTEGFGSFCDSHYSGHAEGLSTIAATTKCVIPITSYTGAILTVSKDENFSYLSSALAKIRSGMQAIIWNTYYANPIPSVYLISEIDITNYTITLNKVLPTSNYQVSHIVIPEISNTTCYYPAHSEGRNTIAIGENSHAEGGGTIASGEYAHAEGYGTIACGRYAHTEGSETKADYYAHAEGEKTIASGVHSHAEGWGSEASGQDSHAEGNGTVAKGQWSHAGGVGTIANTLQYAIGHYNTDVTGGYFSDTSGSSFIIGNGTADNTRSNCFRIQFNGQVFSKGAYSTSGADYAELFEWEDGNPNNEDRRGKFVALSGRKIHIAKPGEIPIGVISSTAAIIGNNHSETWQGMYLKDIWGDVLTEYKEIPAETETIQHPAKMALDEDGNEVIVSEAWEETRILKPEFKGMVPILNPEYNPDDTYIPRHERKEWGIVGLYGQLIVIDDGSCQVNGYCACAEDGTATSSENGYLVIERLDDTHIRILSNFLNTQQQVDTLKEESLSTMEAVTQVYEQGEESEDTAVTSMEAITQNYELILELQATVQKLQEEIQMLKGV